MANKEETKARLESLKKDQESLRSELAALNTFMEKKARRGSEPAPPDEMTSARGQRPGDEPMPAEEEYRRPTYRERPRYQQPAPPRYEPSQRDDEIYDLLKRNLDESRKMMDKFDYLLDTLISSMEEVEGENADELVKALAQSQMHVMEVLS